MVLVDTSAFIEWLTGSPTGEKLNAMMPGQSDRLMPTMVQLELAKWLTREVGDDKADQVIAFTQVCPITSLDTEIALAAAETCRAHKLATADSIVFVTARLRGANLLTCDAHFKGLPGVTLISRVSA